MKIYVGTVGWLLVSLAFWFSFLPTLVSNRSYELPILGFIFALAYFPATYYFYIKMFKKEVKVD